MNRLSIVMVALSALLAACGGGGGAGAVANSAKAYYEAYSRLDFAKMKEMTCEAQKSGLDLTLAPITGSGQTVDQIKQVLKIDVSGLKFEEKSISGNTGTVVVSGKMKLEALGQSQDQDINNEELPMLNENGQWKVCSSKLPGS